MQNRTHTCGELRSENIGEKVRIAGWMENVREVGSTLAFVVVRDFYGTTQAVLETEELIRQIKSLNKESTIAVEGTVRERASKNPKLPTGDIEIVPDSHYPYYINNGAVTPTETYYLSNCIVFIVCSSIRAADSDMEIKMRI